jgi:glyoxylase-like metal-dependent hydrolase (beta-lactamase superfamily II)
MNKMILLFSALLSAIYGAQAQTAPSAPQAQAALPARPFAISDRADKGPKTDSVNVDFMVWLIRGAGRDILVDAGFLKDIPEGKDFEVVHYTRPDSALAKVAIKPEDIADIILTHPPLGPY